MFYEWLCFEQIGNHRERATFGPRRGQASWILLTFAVAMLNNTALDKIEGALSNGYFRTEDFDVQQEGGTTVRLTISYRYDESFQLSARFDSSKKVVVENRGGIAAVFGMGPQTIRRNKDEDPIAGHVSPGEICSYEEFGAETMSELLGVISSWLKHLRRELTSDPKSREQANWQAEIEAKLKEAFQFDGEGENERFSDEEVAELRKRLDALEERLANQVRCSLEDDERIGERIEELHKTVEFLKEQVSRTKKGAMGNAIRSRIAGWFSWFKDKDNQKLLKDSAAVAKLIGAVVKDVNDVVR